MKSCVIGRGGVTFSNAILIAPASDFPTQMGSISECSSSRNTTIYALLEGSNISPLTCICVITTNLLPFLSSIARRKLSTLADGSRVDQCNTSEMCLSTKPARSLEKFMEGSCDQGGAILAALRRVGDNFDRVFRYLFVPRF